MSGKTGGDLNKWDFQTVSSADGLVSPHALWFCERLTLGALGEELFRTLCTIFVTLL